MNKFNYLISGFALLTLVACGDDDDNVRPNDLPAQAVAFMNENRSDQVISLVTQENDQAYCYKVLLTNGEELYFDCDGNLLFSQRDAVNTGISSTDDIIIDADELPASAQAYLTSEFADTLVCFVEMEEDSDELYQYEVVLTNGTEVYFDAEGNHLFTVLDDDYECA